MSYASKSRGDCVNFVEMAIRLTGRLGSLEDDCTGDRVWSEVRRCLCFTGCINEPRMAKVIVLCKNTAPYANC